VPVFFEIAIAAVLAGGLGWLIGYLTARRNAAPHDGRLENELRQQLQEREKELREAHQQLTGSAAALAAAEANRDAAQKLLAETRHMHAENLREAREAQEKALTDLRQAFKALSADALRETAPQFLQLASANFEKLQEAAKGDLAQRQQAIATLVQPLKDQLESYQRRLQQSESSQSLALGEVKKHLEGLAERSQLLSSETAQLRKVLSSNQARGRWGEETLRRVVEAAGMSEHCDFSEQTQAGDGKPDLTVHLPGGRVIIVDAKAPDLDFLRAVDSADSGERAGALATHAANLKATIRGLAERDYPRLYPKALDYVVLFLPAESLFSAALEADRDLIVWAAERRILLTTPASLIALLRAVSVSWQQFHQTENTREIAAAAQELYVRVAKFYEHFTKMGEGLQRANAAYNEAVGSYDSRVRPSGERVLRLSNSTNRELPQARPVDEGLRLPGM
jgi:DNA recombination protein RmuC